MDYLHAEKIALEKEKAILEAELEDYASKGLKLDMSRGKPSPEQLDLSMGLLDIKDYMDDTGVDARNYGNLEGLPEARRFFADALDCLPEETFVAGNSSLELMYHMISIGWRNGLPGSDKPWKDCATIKFLCPVPGYDRHFRVTEIFGFELIPVPMTPDGPDMNTVEALVKDEAVKGIWCVPLYSNPDGYSYSDNTVRCMAALKPAAPDFRIFWDNAYGFHHLYEEQDSCLNILSECKKHGNDNMPLIFCSTSKITFAGAGVCALAASNANIKAATDYLFPMTIGFDKLNQLRHIRFLKNDGGLAAHMKKHAQILAPKFRTVDATFAAGLLPYGNIASWTKPRGGYFISLYVMEGCAARVIALCKKAGVTLTGAGAAYPLGKDPDDRHIRIAPTFPSPAELHDAANLLCIAVRLASIEKLL